MIQAQATEFGEKYWYCRDCRKELDELLKLVEVSQAGKTLPRAGVSAPRRTAVLPPTWGNNPCDASTHYRVTGTSECNCKQIQYDGGVWVDTGAALPVPQNHTSYCGCYGCLAERLAKAFPKKVAQ